MSGTPTAPIRLVIADDHRLFREGLRRLLELEPDIAVVGEATNGDETVRTVRAIDPDIVLLDINMPRMSGADVIKKLRAAGDRPTRAKFIAITAYDDDDHVASLSALGISGYVMKSSSTVDLLGAIRAVHNGESYVDPKVAGKLLVSFHRTVEEREVILSLTSREREVLYWLSQGLNNTEISQKMILSEKTVKNHVSHLLKKLNLNDRTKAAVLAWRIGIVQDPPPLA